MSRQWYLKIADLTKERLVDWLVQKPYFVSDNEGSIDLGSGSVRAGIGVETIPAAGKSRELGNCSFSEIGFTPYRNEAKEDSQNGDLLRCFRCTSGLVL